MACVLLRRRQAARATFHPPGYLLLSPCIAVAYNLLYAGFLSDAICTQLGPSQPTMWMSPVWGATALLLLALAIPSSGRSVLIRRV